MAHGVFDVLAIVIAPKQLSMHRRNLLVSAIHCRPQYFNDLKSGREELSRYAVSVCRPK